MSTEPRLINTHYSAIVQAHSIPSLEPHVTRDMITKDIWNIVIELAVKGDDSYIEIMDPFVKNWTQLLAPIHPKSYS